MASTISETLSSELLQEIKKLHIQARRLATESFSGTYKSAYRGRGIEFEEVREYLPGDDVRSIDWKVTARLGRPYIKSFREERELNVILAIDTSSSTETGTKGQIRKHLIAKLGATLAIIAHANNDRVGMLTFSEEVEKYIPPSKSRSLAWQIIHHVLAESKKTKKTNLDSCISFLTKTAHRSSLIFIISDYISTLTKSKLQVFGAKHEVTALIINDPIDYTFPRAGLAWIVDPESREENLIDFSSSLVNRYYINESKKARENLLKTLRESNITPINLSTNKPFIPELKKHFLSHTSKNIQRKRIYA